MHIKHKLLILAIIVSIFLTYAVHWSSQYFDPLLKNFSILQDNTNQPVPLPHYQKSPSIGKIYTYSGEYHWRNLSPCIIHIIPDDYLESITLNGIKVDLDKRVVSGNRNDWRNGVKIDLSGFIFEGKNNISVQIKDAGGARYGLNIITPRFNSSPIRLSIWALCILSWLFVIWQILRIKSISVALSVMIIVALGGHLVSLSMRPYTDYAYDLYEGNSGHANYILYIVENLKLPQPDKGWSYYHPPLYHISAATVYATAKFLGLSDPFKLLQILSLAYYWGFIFFSLKLIRRFFTNNSIFLLSAALLLFWPSGFINGFRVGNDAAFYFWFAGALFYGHMWFVKNKTKDLYYSVIFSSLGFLTKTNIAPLISILLAVIIYRYIKSKKKQPTTQTLLAIGFIFFSSFSLSTFDNYYYAIKNEKKDWYLAGVYNVDFAMDKRLYSDNNIANYIAPDLNSWIRSPYIDSRDDATGRSNFWNYLFKSSMFGEFSFSSSMRKKFLAPAMGIMLIILIYFSFSGIARLLKNKNDIFQLRSSSSQIDASIRKTGLRLYRRRKKHKSYHEKPDDARFVFAILGMLILALFYSRFKVLTPCLNDFRYVQPILTGIVIGLGYYTQSVQNNHSYKYIIFTLCALFCSASLVFFFGI